MIQDARQDCIRYAKLLGDYQSISCDDLANGYCKALDEGDESMKSAYFSALILRFWYTIDKMAVKSPGINLDYEEFFMWLAEAINYACKYRAWQNPAKKCNAQQAINQCIETIRLQHYYQANLDKHRANFQTVSFDEPLDGEDGDSTLLDTVHDDSDELEKDKISAKLIIQKYIDFKKPVEAIVMDTIAFNDCEKRTKETKKGVDESGNEVKSSEEYTQFWPYRVVQILSPLPDDYEAYFAEKYEISADELRAAVQAVRNANNQRLYKYVDSTIKSLRLSLASSKA